MSIQGVKANIVVAPWADSVQCDDKTNFRLYSSLLLISFCHLCLRLTFWTTQTSGAFEQVARYCDCAKIPVSISTKPLNEGTENAFWVRVINFPWMPPGGGISTRKWPLQRWLFKHLIHKRIKWQNMFVIYILLFRGRWSEKNVHATLFLTL